MRSINTSTTTRLIQITDCHLGAVPGEQLLGLNTDESLLDVLELMKARQSQIDFIVASGDIASAGQVGAYPRFLDIVANYTKAPIAWLAGNHDLDSVMRKVESSARMDHIELEYWQIIMLNSSVPGSEHGELLPAEMLRLKRCLQVCAKPALVFVHHQPVNVGSEWVDQYIIRNADELLDVLNGFSQVKCLVWGHVHQEYSGSYKHFQLRATPSTCVQFKPASNDFAVDVAMPGYRWFDLHADGSFDTAVVRVENKDYGIDFESSGY